MTEDVSGSTETPKTECTFEADSKQVFAYHDGTSLPEGKYELEAGSVIQFRCSSIYNFRLVGSNKLECLNGKWSHQKPRCQSLTPNLWTSAPPLMLSTNRGYPPVTEDGTVVITKNTQIQITCLWSQERPLMNIEGNVYPSRERSFNRGRLAGWTYYFDRIADAISFKFTCATPNINPAKQLSHSINIKVAGTLPTTLHKMRLNVLYV